MDQLATTTYSFPFLYLPFLSFFLSLLPSLDSQFLLSHPFLFYDSHFSSSLFLWYEPNFNLPPHSISPSLSYPSTPTSSFLIRGGDWDTADLSWPLPCFGTALPLCFSSSILFWPLPAKWRGTMLIDSNIIFKFFFREKA